MDITISQYLKAKRKEHLEDYEVREFEYIGDVTKFVQPKQLRNLYTYALANVNTNNACLKTALTIEILTKGKSSFERIRNTIGSPTRKYWGMHNLEFM